MRTRRADLDRLIVFALATFHASFFLLVFLVFLYWQDVLRHILSGLNTLVGLGLFIVLWAITWWTTRRALRDLETDGALLGRAIKWGGVNGVLFLVVLAAGQFVAATALGSRDSVVAILVFSVFFGVVGSFFAYGIGAAIGLALGLVDLGLLAIARGLTRAAVTDVG